MDADERRRANEAVFRVANDDLQRRARELELHEGPVPFLCECSEEQCREIILLSPAEYERIRSLKGHFLIAPEHQEHTEQVVERHDTYWLVRKDG